MKIITQSIHGIFIVGYTCDVQLVGILWCHLMGTRTESKVFVVVVVAVVIFMTII